MGQLVRKLFNLYPGEEKNAVFFSILAFLWAIGARGGWRHGADSPSDL
jgi:hypothetical protein